jgi:ABC-type glutathione transport system ATPase component
MSEGPLLEVRALSKTYARRSTAALRDVSFTLARQRTLGIVGPSGSGKSTLARCLAGFEEPTSGEIRFHGRGRIQLIFQQPAASLNPRFTAREIIEEPLVIQRLERGGKAVQAMELVGLKADALGRRAREFSGGERQRLAIARALVLKPDLLILDESFAGLDPGLTGQISRLLLDLQQRLGLSYIVISHDLDVTAGLADEIAVMQDGAIVEQAITSELVSAPRRPLTRELIAAARALAPDGFTV